MHNELRSEAIVGNQVVGQTQSMRPHRIGLSIGIVPNFLIVEVRHHLVREAHACEHLPGARCLADTHNGEGAL